MLYYTEFDISILKYIMKKKRDINKYSTIKLHTQTIGFSIIVQNHYFKLHCNNLSLIFVIENNTLLLCFFLMSVISLNKL